MPVTKAVRIALEGQTTDGRTIKREEIEQMGSNYNPGKYGARIWLEHIRGMLPDSQFRAYGDVVSTFSKEVDMDGHKKLGLFAVLDVTEDMVAINKARQKIFTSIEIQPNFAGSGQAYLAGLGVTDSPASLGTEALKLFSSRKLDQANQFSEALETTIELEQEPQVENLGTKLFARVKDLLGLSTANTNSELKHFSDAVTAIAESQKDLLDRNSTFSKTLEATVASLKGEVQSITEKFNSLHSKLSKEESPENTQRLPATGSVVGAKTDF
ncbi:GPO family capsid scaffolding protein [Methylobacillus glycogenes]|uniref:GPO family capsid scaffolding protein n=1 Tax=Methylobacillus glycogenes TaxID=406 RepID=UPI0004728135|nr:GPO family capsid scaffolding protein [Methylobacillus glycogenes]